MEAVCGLLLKAGIVEALMSYVFARGKHPDRLRGPREYRAPCWEGEEFLGKRRGCW